MDKKNYTGYVGIGTVSPTQTLDVNGQVRIRVLYQADSPYHTKSIVVADNDGTLKHMSISNIINNSGYYIESGPNNHWKNILLGKKSSKLTFVGRISAGPTDITFSLYITEKNIYVLDKFPKELEIIINSPTSFSVKSLTKKTTYKFVISKVDDQYSNIIIDNPDNDPYPIGRKDYSM